MDSSSYRTRGILPRMPLVAALVCSALTGCAFAPRSELASAQLQNRLLSEQGRRDRAVGVCSEDALVPERREARHQLAVALRPVRRTAHRGLEPARERRAEEARPVVQREHHVRHLIAALLPRDPLDQSRDGRLLAFLLEPPHLLARASSAAALTLTIGAVVDRRRAVRRPTWMADRF